MKIENSHQFYKDIFTTPITPISIAEMHETKFCMGFNDLASLQETVNFNFFGLEKLITLVNFAHDRSLGKNLPIQIRSYIRALIRKILNSSPSSVQKLICAKSLFRVGYVDDFIALVQSDEQLASTPDIKAINALIYIFEGKYEETAEFLADLMKHPYYKNHFLFNIMMMTAFYKCGGTPEIPLDLSSLINGETEAPQPIEWIIKKTTHRKKEIVAFTASDPIYFKEHALSNFLSFAKANNNTGSYHFHIYNADTEIVDAIKKISTIFKNISISATTEIIDPTAKQARTAYTLNRFRAIHSIHSTLDSSIMAVDADSLWRKPIHKNLLEGDLAFCGSPHSPFWENNLGGACFFNKGDASKEFLGLMSKFASNIEVSQQSVWFQDQIALKIAEEILEKKMSCKVNRLDPALWYDTSHRDDAILWQVTTRKDGDKYNSYKTQLNSLLS